MRVHPAQYLISNPNADKKDILSKSADDTELAGLDYKESQGFYSKEP